MNIDWAIDETIDFWTVTKIRNELHKEWNIYVKI